MLIFGKDSVTDRLDDLTFQQQIGTEEERRWMKLAACRGMHSSIFYPDPCEPTLYKRQRQEAQQICRKCFVNADCLEWALAKHETFGIWGGEDEIGRKRIARSRVRESRRKRNIV